MKTLLLILAIGVLIAWQIVEYIKWRKGQMSLRRFTGSLGGFILLLVSFALLPPKWTLGILIAATIIVGIACFRDKRTQG